MIGLDYDEMELLSEIRTMRRMRGYCRNRAAGPKETAHVPAPMAAVPG